MAAVVCSWDVWACRLKVKRKYRSKSCWDIGDNCGHGGARSDGGVCGVCVCVCVCMWYSQRAEKGVQSKTIGRQNQYLRNECGRQPP